MDLKIIWTPPTPVPDCGYIAQYRRKGDSSYSLATSGSTSGTTDYTVVQVSAPANFEGYVQSNCCEGQLSGISPFGVNSWQPLHVTISLQPFPTTFLATVTSDYPNPYATYITGSFNATTISGTTSIPYTVLYPADVTTASLLISGALSATTTVSGNVVTAIAPSFDGGGSLQQLDPSLTPSYFQFYNGSTSGVTWDGSPTSLPSFTLDQFNITAVDGSGNTLAGSLLVSWAQQSVYHVTSGGTIPSPYNQVLFQVKDAGNNIIGTLTTVTGTLGLVNAVITLNRSSNLYPLTPATQLMMITQWANSSTIVSKQFYLP